MTVYLDIIWMLNLLFDSLLLYLTAILLKKDYKIWRILCGGLLGSIIILLNFTSLQSYSGHPIVKLLFSIAMVWTTFGFTRFRTFVRTLLFFYLITFLVGGTLIGIHYFIQFDQTMTEEVLIGSVKGFGDPISWVFILIGFPIAWHFSRARIEQVEMIKIHYDQIVKVTFSIADTHMVYKGLIDSGNQLIDPITRMPVMFVSIAKETNLIPEMLQFLATTEPDQVFSGGVHIPEGWEHKLRIIPAKVVGQDHQLILAIKPDSLQIERDGQVTQVEKGLISFTMQQLSADNTFQCIVHPQMLTGVTKTKSSVKVS